MTRFIKINNRIYNANQIRCISQRRIAGEDQTVVEFEDVPTVVIKDEDDPSDSYWSLFEKLTLRDATVIPAEPGYVLLFYGDGTVSRSDVLAWIVKPDDDEYSVRPIVLYGVPDENSIRWGVLAPDGTVRSSDEEWPDYELWLAVMRELNAAKAVAS